MRNLLFILITTWFLTSFLNQDVNSPLPTITTSDSSYTTSSVSDSTETEKLYAEIQLGEVLQFNAFEQAMMGYQTLPIKNKDIITVIDFTLPSSTKRMYVIDIKNKKLLYHTIVSHGRNSGEKYATAFSNKHGSYQSSLGFYVTENTYQGGNGYSLVLNGLERGINDQAKPRAVVIHGANYCSTSIIASTGRLGRSYGCPALPRELNKPIINTIKEGTMLYIYADNKEYIAKTKVLKPFEQGLLAQHDEIEDNTTHAKLN